MILNDLIQWGESSLKPYTADYKIDANNFMKELLKMDTTALFMAKNQVISSEEIAAYKKMINRRLSGEPFQYIVGHQSFMGLDFLVEVGVLIPRSDTEVLVEKLLEKINSQALILDIGAGSGAIHCSLAYYRPEVSCYAVDISETALMVSKRNAERLKVETRITYLKSDVYGALQGKKFDVIVSNPPYIKKSVLASLQREIKHEPELALDGGHDGYDFYRKIISEGVRYLNRNGLMALEVGHDQSIKVKEMFELSGYRDIEIYKDLQHIDRVVMARYER
jgi:release factor glutamine methyltransferase